MSMESTFGPNWRVKICGYITLGAVSIVAKPDLVAFLPESLANWVRGIAGIIAAVSGAAFIHNTKSKDVTGGTVPATEEAKNRVEPK